MEPTRHVTGEAEATNETWQSVEFAKQWTSRRGLRCLKTTRYFEEQVMRKRAYIQREWCAETLAGPIRREVQSDGRIRFWGRIQQAGETRPRFLRVVTLDDEETVHNAFFDRNFSGDGR